jgi:glycerophosphoryl diester phosphodiesterase
MSTAAAAPLVIAHCGASGYRPEHTLASYQLAVEMGADFIEADLVSTRDHVLVARHDAELSGTTDVADHSEFADRKTAKLVDGVAVTGWFAEDFTVAELKTLRGRERWPDIRPDSTAFDGQYESATLQELIDLVGAAGVGIYLETKHPTYFRAAGLPLEEPLVEVLSANGYTGPSDAVFIESFETANLQQLRAMTAVRLVQLLGAATEAPFDLAGRGDPRTYGDLISPRGLDEIATYAQGIGPWKQSIVPRDAGDHVATPTTLVHRVGDPAGPGYPRGVGDLPGELRQFFALGVDGVFTDNPDVAVAVRSTTGD